MMPSSPSPRITTSRPPGRLAAALTLAMFLLTQPWVLCAPLCHFQGHAQVAMGASQYQDHVIHCHSGKTVGSELPVVQALGSMLPTSWAPVVPSLRVVTLAIESPAPIHLQQVPAADPPPPRSV